MCAVKNVQHETKNAKSLNGEEMGGVQDQTHQASTNGTSNGNGHDPSGQQKANTLPVDSLVSSVAQSNTDGSASDAHGGGNGQGVLRENQNCEGSTHLHGGTAGWGVVGDLVTHD